MVDIKELKKLLYVREITMQQLAERACVDVSTVYRWFQSPEKMTVGTVDMIRDFTEMSKEEFLRIFYTHKVA